MSSVKSFLDLIAKSEGTSSGLDNGYGVIVSGIDGSNTFSDYLTHPFANGRPAIVVRPGPIPPRIVSTASGRYQCILHNWIAYSKLLNLPDFDHESQDLIALRQLKECGSFALIANGDIKGAIEKACHIWASFPGNSYRQAGGRSMDQLLQWFNELRGMDGT
jgi:muramidase (phage lysozyme)